MKEAICSIGNVCSSCLQVGTLEPKSGGGSGGPEGSVWTSITLYVCKNCKAEHELYFKAVLGKGTILEIRWKLK